MCDTWKETIDAIDVSALAPDRYDVSFVKAEDLPVIPADPINESFKLAEI